MRFTIVPSQGHPVLLRSPEFGQVGGFYLINSMVEGWFGTPTPREDSLEASGRDGDIFPSKITQGSRTVIFYGAIDAESSVEASLAIDTINALVGKTLTIYGKDAGGLRIAKGFLIDDPQPKHYPGEQIVEFSLVIKCPDPHKYSEPVPFQSTGSKINVVNQGNVDTWPMVKVDGPVTNLSLSFMGHTLVWSGSATALTIDFREPSASAGTLTKDDVFSLPPGTSTVSVSSDAQNIVMLVPSAWR